MKWDYSNIPDQQGRIALVTGANSGLGYYTALGLAEKGAKVILACRDVKKAEAAKMNILGLVPDAILEVRELDLSSLASIKTFSNELIKGYKRIDLLVNNAGVLGVPYTKTTDGFEKHFGVNYLGHFALTARIFELLRNVRSSSRIVTVSSSVNYLARIRFEDIHWERRYSRWGAYAMSKLANLLFSSELSDRAGVLEKDLRIVAAHPGYANSELTIKGPESRGKNSLERFYRFTNRRIAQTTAMGALPQLFAATSPLALNGAFYGPDGFLNLKGYPERIHPKSRFLTKENQQKLWELSEELTGISFPVI